MNGTWVRSMPATRRNSSPDKCGELPLPPEGLPEGRRLQAREEVECASGQRIRCGQHNVFELLVSWIAWKLLMVRWLGNAIRVGPGQYLQIDTLVHSASARELVHGG